MGRAPCCDKANVKKGPWSPEEDAKLKAFIEQNGTGGNWITLPMKAGLKRCGKSCRLRWINYLRPDIKHGSFTEEEERIIYNLHATIGSRWSLIANQLPGRTDNDIKNYWNTRLKKKFCDKGLDTPSNRQQTYLRQSGGMGGLNHTFHHSGSQLPTDALLQQMLKPQLQPQHHYHHTPTLDVNHLTMTHLKHMQPLSIDMDDTHMVHMEKIQAVKLMEVQAQLKHQMQSVKNEIAERRAATTAPNELIDERLMMIENGLRSCITSPVSSQLSPVALPDNHHSPASSCSGISTDRSNILAPCAESAYTENFGFAADNRRNSLTDSSANGLVLPTTTISTASAHVNSSSVHRPTQSAVASVGDGYERFGLIGDQLKSERQKAEVQYQKFGLPDHDDAVLGALDAVYKQQQQQQSGLGAHGLNVVQAIPIAQQASRQLHAVKDELHDTWTWESMMSPKSFNATAVTVATTPTTPVTPTNKWLPSSPRYGQTLFPTPTAHEQQQSYDRIEITNGGYSCSKLGSTWSAPPTNCNVNISMGNDYGAARHQALFWEGFPAAV